MHTQNFTDVYACATTNQSKAGTFIALWSAPLWPLLVSVHPYGVNHHFDFHRCRFSSARSWTLSCAASFTQRYHLVSPRCTAQFVLFHCCVLFHHPNTLQCVYPATCWWTWGQSAMNIKLLWVFSIKREKAVGQLCKIYQWEIDPVYDLFLQLFVSLQFKIKSFKKGRGSWACGEGGGGGRELPSFPGLFWPRAFLLPGPTSCSPCPT